MEEAMVKWVTATYSTKKHTHNCYLAKYCKRRNIRVNCISPVGLLSYQTESFLECYRSFCNNKGILDAINLVGTLLYLIPSQSKYVYGQNIIIGDGWSA